MKIGFVGLGKMGGKMVERLLHGGHHVVAFDPIPAAVKEAEKKGASKEERQLYGLSSSAGWRVLKEFIDSLIEDLESLNSSAIASGATFEEIGKNTLVVSMSKGIIKKAMDKVEDARESIDAEQK